MGPRFKALSILASVIFLGCSVVYITIFSKKALRQALKNNENNHQHHENPSASQPLLNNENGNISNNNSINHTNSSNNTFDPNNTYLHIHNNIGNNDSNRLIQSSSVPLPLQIEDSETAVLEITPSQDSLVEEGGGYYEIEDDEGDVGDDGYTAKEKLVLKWTMLSSVACVSVGGPAILLLTTS